MGKAIVDVKASFHLLSFVKMKYGRAGLQARLFFPRGTIFGRAGLHARRFIGEK